MTKEKLVKLITKFKTLIPLSDSEKKFPDFKDLDSFSLTSAMDMLNGIQSIMEEEYEFLSSLKKIWENNTDIIDDVNLNLLQRFVYNSFSSEYLFFIYIFNLIDSLNYLRVFDSFPVETLITIGSAASESDIEYPSNTTPDYYDDISWNPLNLENSKLENFFLPYSSILEDVNMLTSQFDSLPEKFLVSCYDGQYLCGKGISGFGFRINSDGSGYSLYPFLGDSMSSTLIDHEKHKYLGVLLRLEMNGVIRWVDCRLEYDSETDSYKGDASATNSAGHFKSYGISLELKDDTLSFKELSILPYMYFTNENMFEEVEQDNKLYGTGAVVFPLDSVAFSLTENLEQYPTLLAIRDLNTPIFKTQNFTKNMQFQFPNLYQAYNIGGNLYSIFSLIEGNKVEIKYNRLSR